MFVIPAPNSVAFDLFGFPIYWYGITMALAIFVAMIVANKLFNCVNKNLQKDVIIEYAPLIIICGILGARLYFCLLNTGFYFNHPLEILDLRQGGLSIHGAIFGGILSLVFIAWKIKSSFMNILDSLACATFLGQAIGRWGNYFNSEAYGVPVVGQNWGLFIPQARRVAQYVDYSLFHPTFLYESVLDICGFGILIYIILKFGKKMQGLTFFTYLVIYAIIRFLIEQIRVDSALDLGTVPIAQIVSVILFVVGVLGILIINRLNKV